MVTTAGIRRGSGIPWPVIWAAAIATGCWGNTQHPRARALPGEVWVTPAQPFRLPGWATAVAADDHTAIVTGAGWLVKMDLDSGLVTTSNHDAKLFSVSQLIPLPDGRLLAVGTRDDRLAAATIDRATLVETPIELPAVAEPGPYWTAGAVIVPDGRVVLAGPGVPLALYDPKTWKVAVELAPEHDWTVPLVANDTLYAMRAGSLEQFDLVALTHQPFARMTWTAFPRAAGPTLAYEVDEGRKTGINVIVGGAPKFLATAVHGYALDPAGSRIVWIDGTMAHVTSLTGAEVPDQVVELGASARGQSANLVLTDHRAIVVTGPIVRVIDLASGAVSAAGAPPYAVSSVLAVGDDGRAIALGNEAWSLRDGRVTASTALRGRSSMWLPQIATGHAGVYSSSSDRGGSVDASIFELIAVGKDAAVGHVAVEHLIFDGWLGANDRAVVNDTEGLAWLAGGKLTRIVSLAVSALVDDVDPAGAGTALVTSGGTISVIPLDTGVPLEATGTAPRCDEHASGVLEPAGRRYAVYADGDLIVFDRATARVLGSAHFAADVRDVRFVPGHSEVLVLLDGHAGTFTPGEAVAQLVPVASATTIAASPGASKLAVAFDDGRVAVAAYASFRAGLVSTSITKAAVPATCPVGEVIETARDDDDLGNANDDDSGNATDGNGDDGRDDGPDDSPDENVGD